MTVLQPVRNRLRRFMQSCVCVMDNLGALSPIADAVMAKSAARTISPFNVLIFFILFSNLSPFPSLVKFRLVPR
jgi:hypothetical protein